MGDRSGGRGRAGRRGLTSLVAIGALMLSGVGLASPAAAASPPVAVPDTVTAVAGQLVTVHPLANDSDPDGEALSLQSVVVTSGSGTAGVVGDTVEITADRAFVGQLVATYTVADSTGATATSTITAEVSAAPNGRPVTTADSATVVWGHSVSIKVLANDSDPDGDALRLVKVSEPKRGSARVSGSKVVYRANSRYLGTVRLTYRVRDAHGATDTGRITVTVTRRNGSTTLPAKASRASVEKSLARLGLPVGWANGTYDSATRRAVCAWRVITGRNAHRGLPTAAEARAIVGMDGLPRARSVMVTGVTVSVTCQAAFWVNSNRQYRRVMAACTGMPGYRTRLGTFRIFITHHTWRYSTIYPEARMYKPMQFSGGQAIHGSATDSLVKTYPASHGCVRMFHRDIDALQAGGVGNGTVVKVIGHW